MSHLLAEAAATLRSRRRRAAVLAGALCVACSTVLCESRPPEADIRTRHASFRPSSFGELPGWQHDDVRAAWGAFRHSCRALQRRDGWRELCAAAPEAPPSAVVIRAFFESRFALLRILDADAGRDGDVTGYFEPLLDGRSQRGGAFTLPVMGIPRDLHTLDWARVPPAQRRGIVHVKPVDGTLALAAASDAQAHALDLRRVDLDTRDRRLRLRLTDADGVRRALPYHSRAELETLGLPGGIDATVLAWVDDPLALYAMQVQGSGRIRMADGMVLRVHYGEQNGHPFRPLRVLAKADDKVRTRSLGAAGDDATASKFVLESDDAAVDSTAEAIVTRGIPRTQTRTAPQAATQDRDAAANLLVEQLLAQARRREPAPGLAAPPIARPVATPASAAAPPPAARSNEGAPTVSASTLLADPSYVFFTLAADQSPRAGPLGALGVPLTAGRSVAIDPRITPLGYPVFLATRSATNPTRDMRQLVFAQDTGGAIRGALRADYFWGFGAAAGQLARGTRHRGQMWLLLPKAEAQSLARGDGVVTRGLPGQSRPARGECLLADGEFCVEVDR